MNRQILNTLISLLLIAATWVSGQMPAIAGEAVSGPKVEVLSPTTTPPDEPTAPASTPSQASVKDLYDQMNTLFDKAFEATNKGDFQVAEDYWTQVIERFPQNPAAWSNRGNAKVSQNKFQSGMADYDQAIKLAPNSPDPYLNKGTALEALGKFDEAIASYNKVLELDPKDAAAYNNRGNAKASQGKWDEAIVDFNQAINLARDYAFARANLALALYQTGKTDEAVRTMRFLVRKYPKFADMRAALTAALWVQGKQGEAESQWVSVVGLDARYKDLNWLKSVRRWPPQMVTAMEKFLTLRSSNNSAA